ncbi:ECF transporter S component [Helcococcus kunzii]|uniref:ECF transporter S component n=1 Tax=Helcococcus kunzii TaxID=40091 RepID=UPI0024ACA1F7|nr:ECF transporter S component [Helcococcus kunzii]
MNKKILKLAQSAIFAALAFISFTYFQIKIPVPGGGDFTSIHFGNIFLVVATLTIGGFYGGLAGAVGMTIADLLDPVYAIVAPKTFILKLCIGLIVGLIAHRLKKINLSDDKKYIMKWAVIASICGMAFNVVADPLVGYFYKRFLLGQPQDIATALAKLSAGVTLFNAVITVIIANIIYNAIRPILKKVNLL